MFKKSAGGRKKSMIKSAIWRIWGIIFLALVTYFYTGNLITTTIITFTHHFMFLWIYYFHERFWNRLNNTFMLRHKRIFRPLIYEIVLGNMILGSISLIFTGSWTAVTGITLTYILNKLWMYQVYDWIWNKIVKQKEKTEVE